tara:strand:- start:319 stop:663 length:345 start_codon:yes stop_codon:yes gene_type:complete
MPMYPVVNKKTGEEKDVVMSFEEYDKWREENPDWDRDWMKGVAGVRNPNRHPGAYGSDAICDDTGYEDKNNSLSVYRNQTPDGQFRGRNFVPPPPGAKNFIAPDRTPRKPKGVK